VVRILKFFRKFDPVLVSIALLSSFLRSLIPVSLELNSPHDDLLGAWLARSLLSGTWLGPWDIRTLAKPPGYSFFLYFAHFVPIDITLLTHLLYMAVAFYLSWLLGKVLISGHRMLVVRSAFLLFAFNPAVFGADFSRVHRINLSTILVFLFISLNLGFLIQLKAYAADRTARKTRRGLLVTSVALGLVYSFLILTRVESYWVLVVPVVCLGLSVRPAVLKLTGACLVLFVATYFVPIAIVSSINKSHYGVREVESFFTGNFARAITLWASVDEGRSEKTFVSVSKEQRAAVYLISSTAKRLSPVLDGAPNTGWKILNCTMTKVCDEAGNWFPWEMRDAAVAAGVNSEVEFQSFFQKIADDISSACHSHLLTCGSPGLAPASQPLNRLPKMQILDIASRVLGSLVTVEQARNTSRPAPTDDDLKWLPFWHWTVHFRYETTAPGVSEWKVMAHAVEFLRRLYEAIVPIGLVLFVISMIDPRTHGLQRIWLLSVVAAILLCIAGLALFEQALGFTATYSLYALPAQPLLLILVVSGWLYLVTSRWPGESDAVR